MSAILLALCLALQSDARDRIVVLITLDGLPAYAFDDPKLPAPTLRRLAREGASARAMTVVNPAVTWPNHATLATGVRPARHGVIFNGLLVRDGPGQPVRVEQRGRDALVRVPTVYDVAHAAGLTTAHVNWIPHQTGGTITWAFPERPDPKGPVEQELVAAGILTEAELVDFNKSNPPWRDHIWTQAAVHIIRKRKPNLLLFHLLNLDSTHHKYGPRTHAGQNAIAYADGCVRDVLDAIDAAGLKDRATVIVASDHGFKAVKKNIRPNAALRQKGMVRLEGSKVLSCDAWSFPEGGTAMVYVTRADRREETLARVREIVLALEGVERLVESAEYEALGLPSPKENGQMADLVIVAKPGYAFGSTPEGEPVVDVPVGLSLGHHGYLSSDPDMDAIFIAWGWGIRAGERLERIENVDVAPTVAALLGLAMRNVTGKPLREILK